MFSWISKLGRERRGVELETADKPYTLNAAERPEAMRTIDDLWKNYVHLQSVVVAAQLKLPDVIGDDRLTLAHLQRRLRCENSDAFRHLVETLLEVGLLARTEDDDDVVFLTALGGAACEGACWYDLERLFDPTMHRVWDGLASIIANPQSHRISHNEGVLASYVGKPSLDYHGELREAVHHAGLPKTDAITIAYSGMCDATATLQTHNPSFLVVHLQSSNDPSEQQERASVMILHRSIGLYGYPDAGRIAHEGGVVMVIDCFEEDSDPSSRLFASACGLPAPPSTAECIEAIGIEMLSTTLPCGTRMLHGTLPTKV